MDNPFQTILDRIGSIEKLILDLKSTPVEEILISPSEACKLFQPSISLVTLASWTKDGHLISQKIKGRVFYKKSQILDAGTKLKRYKKSLPATN